MDRFLLIAAVLCFVASFGATIYALGAGHFRPGLISILTNTAGFVCLTGFLYLRGKAEGSCPLGSLFDVLIFQSWSLVLIYLLIGTAYRLSLMGTFTALLAFLLLLVALVVPMDQSLVPMKRSPWVEFHAALSIIAYGAFGLACIAGVMYLLQEKLLKAHKVSSLLYNLPPISDLTVANRRLLWLGFGLLSVAFAAGFVSGLSVNSLKMTASLIIWLIYGAVLILYHFRTLAPRRMAGLSVGVFALAMVTLPGIQYFSTVRP